MPRAVNMGQKFHYLDHDTDVVNVAPPILNQWYEVFHAYDVRLLYCVIFQTNTEANAKNLEVRWTIDGTVYFVTVAAVNGAWYCIFRDAVPSGGGAAGLSSSVGWYNAAFYVDKRGLDFKVEVRITSALGTNQTLTCWCVRETLELT